MKLKFNKSNEIVSVFFLDHQGMESEFSYLKMIDILYKDREIDFPITEGSFSEDERKSIEELVTELQKAIQVEETSDNSIVVEKFTEENELKNK